MSVINTNVKSLVAQKALTVNNRNLSDAMEKLSTGSRINSAKDDAAGLAISNKMTAQIKGLNQAIRNANDGVSMIQTAEGATKEVTNMLNRMRELSVQAANDTNTSTDRGALTKEFAQLTEEIDRISTTTQWNGMKLFSEALGSAGGIGEVAGVAKLQVGANTGTDQIISVTFKKIDATGLGLTASTAADLGDTTKAQAEITKIDAAMVKLDGYRADFGAKINRLTYAADNLANVSENTSASRSRIQDTDYAATTTELARTQIISQAATAMLAQANQAPQSVLTLLR